MPLIFILPDMKACMPLSLPDARARKSASLSVMLQSALPGPLVTVDALQSTVHSLVPSGPPESTKWSEPPTFFPSALSAASAAPMLSKTAADMPERGPMSSRGLAGATCDELAASEPHRATGEYKLLLTKYKSVH